MNKYDELANIIMDAFSNCDLTSNVRVGSTLNVKWDEVVTDEFVCFGVLNPSGASDVRLSDGILAKGETLSLAIALPNNETHNGIPEYAEALSKFEVAIGNLCKEAHEVNGEEVIIANNGRTSTEFITIKGGKEIGVLSQSLTIAYNSILLNTMNATITLKAHSNNKTYEFRGWYNYIIGKQKTFDSTPIKATPQQKNFENSISKTLTIDYYKIKEEELHTLLESDNEIFTITLNDGNNNVLNELDMNISNYTQNGVMGGFINCKVTFIDGVV